MLTSSMSGGAQQSTGRVAVSTKMAGTCRGDAEKLTCVSGYATERVERCL
jgi:hypothetical protein